MNRELNTFAAMCEVIGAEATETQTNNLVEFVIDNIPKHLWSNAADLALANGLGDVYTDMTMRMGECGLS